MTRLDDRTADAALLRRRAEEIAQQKAAPSPENLEDLSPEQMGKMLHELRVHQIELEMQNEELRRAQLELEKAHDRYFELYDLAPVGYFTLNEKGVFLEANLTLAKLLGVARSALNGQPLSRFLGKEDQDVFYLFRKKLLATGEPQAWEQRMVKQDGTSFWAQLEAIAAQDSDDAAHRDRPGSPVCRVVLSDITERKQAEAQRLDMERRLLHAQRMESLGVMAGGIAHDFNNMLSVIIGYSESILSSRSPADPLHRQLKEISAAANRSAELTRQLLAFSGRQAIAPRPMDLNAQLRSMEPLLRRTLGADISLEMNLAPGLWPVYLDPGQVYQIMANLAIHSRNTLPQVGRLTVETRNVASPGAVPSDAASLPGDHVQLTIRDNGCEMSPETLAHGFEPFYPTKSEDQGNGLGLAAVHGIVEQNRGSIRLENELGRGTAVTIAFPRQLGKEQAAAPAAGAPGPAGGDETVLLVEDEPQLRTLLTIILEGLGYRVLPAMSPGEALAICDKHLEPIHLLLTDVSMPEMNGKELFARISESNRAIKVLYMSGYNVAMLTNQGVLDLGIHFIQKPFAKETLARKLREELDA